MQGKQQNGNTQEQLLKELLEQNRKLSDKIEKLEQDKKEQISTEKHDPDFYRRLFIVVSVVAVVGLLIFFITRISTLESENYKQKKYQEAYEDITRRTRQ